MSSQQAIKQKKQLGQFLTKNSNYILKNLDKYIEGKEIVDPFAGEGDLIDWARRNKAKKVIGYDIDNRCINGKDVFLNDSLLNPLKYKFVLTNPPYLNINKANKKTKRKYFSKFEFEDLYQISLSSILNSEEGIVIVPINFLSARNSRKIKNIFFHKFEIVEMNYFTHPVFSDTTNNVIAFYYKKKKNPLNDRFSIKTRIYPGNKILNIKLKRNCSWNIHGDFLDTIKNQKNELGIYRLVEKDVDEERGQIEIPIAHNHIEDTKTIKVSEDFYNAIKSNIIFLKAIDSGTENGKISLEDIRKYGVKCLISKESSRHMIHLIFKEKIPIAKQKKIIDIFNQELNKMRDQYLSLFLTNYRDNNRKRVSFDFVYKFINYIYFNKINPVNNQQLL
ncbi:MAG: Eco57I restriction-modification methylase domain-containing protein [Candidatus Nealsonbacteria bacterium]